MKSYGKKLAKEARRNILLERAYDLLTYFILVAMGIGVAIAVFELFV